LNLLIKINGEDKFSENTSLRELPKTYWEVSGVMNAEQQKNLKEAEAEPDSNRKGPVSEDGFVDFYELLQLS